MTDHQIDINELDAKLQKARHLLLEIKEDAGTFPFIERNTARALASIKMMELNISDIVVNRGD